MPQTPAHQRAKTKRSRTKSEYLAITVRMQPSTQTLKDADIEAVGAKVIDKVTKATGGVLRG